MRKKLKYLLFAFLGLMLINNVNAECSYEEQVKLNDLASTVKATYEETEIDTGDSFVALEDAEGIKAGDVVKVLKPGFIVKIFNITDKIYINVKNSYNNESKDYYYNDTDNGSLTLNALPADEMITYTITIRSYTETCAGQELRVANLVTPYYNEYSQYTICETYPEYENCQKFLTGNTELTFDSFMNGAKSYSEKHQENEKEEIKESKKNFFNNIKDYFKKHKKIIIIIISSIVVIGIAGIIMKLVNKKKRLV